MCLGSVCDRVFELSPFVLRGSVLVELQTLKTVFSDLPCRAWLGGWKYRLPSYVGVDELEPLHGPSHVHCLFEPHCKPGSRSRGGPAGLHQHLVSGASVVGEPCHKVALWELKAIAGNHKAVRRREIYQAVTIAHFVPRANLTRICRVLLCPQDRALRSSPLR